MGRVVHLNTHRKSLTVSAIRSSFLITAVPDWHKIDFSVTSKKKKKTKKNNHTHSEPPVTHKSSGLQQYKYSCTDLRSNVSSVVQTDRGKLGEKKRKEIKIMSNDKLCCW